MENAVLIIKASGKKEPFSASKLEESLARAGASPNIIGQIVRHVTDELQEGMTTEAIYSHAFFLLKKLERPSVSRYSLKHAVKELGPTGYPFEHFVSEIFKAKGFEVKTNQLARGHCTDHEIDIVAWNENKLIMVEAKFHNDLGLKSDVKVALYIKARFDDLRTRTHRYGGDERTLSEFWLITNTKFTEQATHFGECSGIKMVGWNYPLRGNLHDLIDDAGLHPLTCLTTLSVHDKRALFEKNVVLCKTIRENRSVLKPLGLKEERIKEIVEESEAVCEPRTML